MKGNSLNKRRQVQSDFLKRVERLCGEEVALAVNSDINLFMLLHNRLPIHVNISHYRSLSKEVRKPVKYSNKAK